MTATHAEVLSSLPPELAAGQAAAGPVLAGSDGERRWQLALAPEGRHRIGTLDLPMTELEIRLQGYSDEERTRFLERLALCCRRGGG